MNIFTAPGRFDGMELRIIDAQKQARTARDVRGPWVRPKVPSKARGRRGTRRAWKRKNAPHCERTFRPKQSGVAYKMGPEARKEGRFNILSRPRSKSPPLSSHTDARREEFHTPAQNGVRQ